jgi:DNA-binding CsgD family transcriptional regulator
MGSAPDFDLLIDAIYGAAGAPEAWPSVTSMLADVIGAVSACLFIWNKQDNTFSLTAPSRRMDPKANALYEAYYGARDSAVAPLAVKPIGQFMLCQELFSDAYVQRSEFYNDFLIPVGGVRYRAGTRLLEDEEKTVLLAVNRSARNGPFERNHMMLLGRITSHLTRAVELHLRLSKFVTREAIFTDVLDRIGGGIIVVDGRSKVLMMNRAAEMTVASGDTLSVRNGKLGASQPDDSNALQRQVADAVKAGAGEGHSSGSVLAIRRRSAPCPLAITIVPLIGCTAARVGAQQQTAALFFANPDHESGLSPMQLKRLFGLTLAEARIAAAISSGLTLDAIAAKYGITKNTVRNQLRSAFAKTDTNRQADLVRLLSRLSPSANW